jgi:hypothetical protein
MYFPNGFTILQIHKQCVRLTFSQHNCQLLMLVLLLYVMSYFSILAFKFISLFAFQLFDYDASKWISP